MKMDFLKFQIIFKNLMKNLLYKKVKLYEMKTRLLKVNVRMIFYF